jgi:hypothetical protein
MSMPPMPTPPPLPPAAQAASPQVITKRGWRRLPGWAWALILLLVVGSIVALSAGGMILGRFLGEGWDIFEGDAREALQRNPTIQTHIGMIREIGLNVSATGNSLHPDDFVFNLEGDRGEGRVRARFETTLDGERIREGELRMKDGSKWPLAPDPEY